MTNYAALERYLRQHDDAVVALSFPELDRLVEGLPASATKYPAWWANSRTAQPHAHYWLDAGRRATPDFAAHHVRFTWGSETRTGPRAPTPTTYVRANPHEDSRAAPTYRDGREFELHAAEVLSRRWNVDLSSRPVTLKGGVIKKFDLVSSDGCIVGDAKYYKNIAVPAAKWSTLAEYVWLLQHVEGAQQRFMVFGFDREVADRWLKRFRPLTEGLDFGSSTATISSRSRGPELTIHQEGAHRTSVNSTTSART